MSRDEAPKTDLLLRRRREQKRQEAQERRDQIRKPMLWVAIAILFWRLLLPRVGVDMGILVVSGGLTFGCRAMPADRVRPLRQGCRRNGQRGG